MAKKILIFADGACKGNPGPGGWAYLVADPDRIVEDSGAAAETTNNRMEITALIEAFEYLVEEKVSGDIHIYLDSQYVLSGASAWIYGWARRGWVTSESEPVKNRDLWQRLLDSLSQIKKESTLKWYYVEGHAGIPGNERVDELASGEAEGNPREPFLGRRSEFPHGGLESRLPAEAFDPNRLSQPKKKVPVYYLSYLDGKIYRDPTWPECEARVRGRPGAKYKKVKSLDEEKEVLRSWGHRGE